MKIEVTEKELIKTVSGENQPYIGERLSFSHDDQNGSWNMYGLDNSFFDLTDVVKEQLKVKVPEQMPWYMYEEIKKYINRNFKIDFILDNLYENRDEDIHDWLFSSQDRKMYKNQITMINGLQYGFKLSERRFRIPLTGLTVYGRPEHICYDKENKELWAADEDYDENSYSEFTESELKKLNAPDWVMQLPREYVDEDGEIVNEKN
ncbi:hypothetical protein [Paucilactobacillus sp. N302-9]